MTELRFRAEPAHDHKGRRHCDGVKESGYWKGWPCNAFAKFRLGEHEFCGAHFAIYSAALETAESRPSPEGTTRALPGDSSDFGFDRCMEIAEVDGDLEFTC